MRRKIICCIGIIMSVVLFSGCGNSGTATNSDNNNPQATEVYDDYEPESMIEEEKVLWAFEENNFEDFYFMQASYFLESYSDDEKLENCNMLLDLFEQMGVDVSAYTADSLLENLLPLCQEKNEENMFVITSDFLGADTQNYLEIYENYEIYTVMKLYYFGGYCDAGKDNWFGETTDEQRVAAAGDIINCFSGIGYEITITPEEFVEKMNDYYNAGNDDVSVMEAALNFLPQDIDYDKLQAIWEKYDIMNLDFD